MRKICTITGSRAEYGLLSGLMAQIKSDKELRLQVIATNMHLSPIHGLTYKEIEEDGFIIDKKIENLLVSDTPCGTAKSVGLAIIGFADAFAELNPDLIVVLGDRYEILAAVSAALFYKIPVAHLYGGEITEGAYDDSIRHAITKMSHLHFTSTMPYRNRIIQMGEQPDHVFHVGAIGIENIKRLTVLPKLELEQSLNFELSSKTLLITYHPVTLEDFSAKEQCQNLLSALAQLKDYRFIFTMPNSDTDNYIITQLINDFVNIYKDRSIAFKSLGKTRYLSLLKYVTAVIGNSSSGLVEVPSFGIPTLNIGNRQKGRISGESVVHCDNTLEGILQGIEIIVSDQFRTKLNGSLNPYEKENTIDSIKSILKNFPLDHIIQKSFYNLP